MSGYGSLLSEFGRISSVIINFPEARRYGTGIETPMGVKFYGDRRHQRRRHHNGRNRADLTSKCLNHLNIILGHIVTFWRIRSPPQQIQG